MEPSPDASAVTAAVENRQRKSSRENAAHFWEEREGLGGHFICTADAGTPVVQGPEAAVAAARLREVMAKEQADARVEEMRQKLEETELLARAALQVAAEAEARAAAGGASSGQADAGGPTGRQESELPEPPPPARKETMLPPGPADAGGPIGRQESELPVSAGREPSYTEATK